MPTNVFKKSLLLILSVLFSYQVVLAEEPLELHADFSSTDNCIGDITSFTDASTISEGAIDSWHYEFGDGNESFLQNPNHGYLIPGVYDVKLVITSGIYSDSITKVFEIHAYPVASISVSGSLEFCDGDSVTMGVNENPLYTYQWMIGDVEIAGATASNYKVKKSGAYKLVIENEIGCTAMSSSIDVSVLPSPEQPTISVSGATEFCEGDSLVLSVNPNPDLSYEWRLNGGAIGIDASSIVVNSSGSYNLAVHNEYNCVVNSAERIDVTVSQIPELPILNRSGSLHFCEGEGLQLSINNPGDDSYQWMNEYGPIVGETGSSIGIPETGAYFLRVRNAASCEVYSSPVYVTVEPYPELPIIVTQNYEPYGCPDYDPVSLSVVNPEENTDYQWMRNGIYLERENNTSITGYLSEGDYALRASNIGCRVESEPISIYYADVPDKPTIIAFGPVEWYLACSNDSASAYKWYYNSKEIIGATNFIYWTNNQLGKYEVSISENGGCFSISDPVWIPLGTGIETDLWANLKVYPNPTPGLFSLEMDNQIMGELIIDIFDESGKQVFKIKFLKETAHFQTQIDLSGQPAAVYMIGLMLEDYRASRRLIVE